MGAVAAPQPLQLTGPGKLVVRRASGEARGCRRFLAVQGFVVVFNISEGNIRIVQKKDQVRLGNSDRWHFL